MNDLQAFELEAREALDMLQKAANQQGKPIQEFIQWWRIENPEYAQYLERIYAEILEDEERK